jgi:hypothetical protein
VSIEGSLPAVKLLDLNNLDSGGGWVTKFFFVLVVCSAESTKGQIQKMITNAKELV